MKASGVSRTKARVKRIVPRFFHAWDWFNRQDSQLVSAAMRLSNAEIRRRLVLALEASEVGRISFVHPLFSWSFSFDTMSSLDNRLYSGYDELIDYFNDLLEQQSGGYGDDGR